MGPTGLEVVMKAKQPQTTKTALVNISQNFFFFMAEDVPKSFIRLTRPSVTRSR